LSRQLTRTNLSDSDAILWGLDNVIECIRGHICTVEEVHLTWYNFIWNKMIKNVILFPFCWFHALSKIQNRILPHLPWFISSTCSNSYSQYLKTVDAITCTFCRFRISTKASCFLIALKSSATIFSSFFVSSPIFYFPLAVCCSISFTFKSLSVWLSVFILIWPLVRVDRTFLLSELKVEMVLK
jgi:hypothetical protein